MTYLSITDFIILVIGCLVVILGFIQILFGILESNPETQNRRTKSGINYLAYGVIILLIFDNINSWKVRV